MTTEERSGWHVRDGDDQDRPYRALFLRFFVFSLICTFVPLAFIASYLHRNYSEFSHSRMTQSFQRRIESSQSLVQLFLKERLFDLKLITRLSTLEYLSDASSLRAVFDFLNEDREYFEDLGVIKSDGFHVSYVGPYDLMKNDYSVTFWFRELMTSKAFFSDMFLGYRNVPHFIIAVLKEENGGRWILRATLETQALSSMLQGITIARTGEVFLLNAQGFYQTAPKSGGKILEKSDLPMERFTEETGIEILDGDGKDVPRKIVAYSWLRDPRWLLVVRQDHAEFFADMAFADRATTFFLIVSSFAILAVVTGSTIYIIATIKRRDRERETMNRQLIQAGKLASIGQLAAGVAHEINNPLAVIQSEVDMMREFGDSDSFSLPESYDRIEGQVQRCGKITRDILGFSRRIHTEVHEIDINQAIRESVSLCEKWASTAGIRIAMDLAETLPPVPSDPFEIEQVLLNLVANAVHALEEKMAGGTIRIRSQLSRDGRMLKIVVEDDGCGIPAQHLDKIFDPFFTTKPQGKGTGLGLSISYSIVKRLGGDIHVRSQYGKGSEFSITLPVSAAKGGLHATPQSSPDRR
ncbi:MAG: two-component sensor histidine kinase [Desulfobacteraceae bacterium]|nr:two-component sensor histidine kinase [Desulfobacteraceae bacterium]